MYNLCSTEKVESEEKGGEKMFCITVHMYYILVMFSSISVGVLEDFTSGGL